MKKLILAIIGLAVGFVGYAQNGVEIPQKLKDAINVSNNQVDYRMTDSMSDEDIRLEFINNYFKIEIADLILKDSENLSKKQDKLYNETMKDNHSETNISGQIFTADLAIRTTKDMRPSIFSNEEITA